MAFLLDNNTDVDPAVELRVEVRVEIVANQRAVRQHLQQHATTVSLQRHESATATPLAERPKHEVLQEAKKKVRKVKRGLREVEEIEKAATATHETGEQRATTLENANHTGPTSAAMGRPERGRHMCVRATQHTKWRRRPRSAVRVGFRRLRNSVVQSTNCIQGVAARAHFRRYIFPLSMNAYIVVLAGITVALYTTSSWITARLQFCAVTLYLVFRGNAVFRLIVNDGELSFAIVMYDLASLCRGLGVMYASKL